MTSERNYTIPGGHTGCSIGFSALLQTIYFGARALALLFHSFVGRQGYRLDSGRVAFIRASDSVWSLGPMPLSELRLEGTRMPQEARTWIGR